MKFIDTSSTIWVELVTAIVGLIVVVIPTWRLGVKWVVKQREKIKESKKQEQQLIAKIHSIEHLIREMDVILKDHIAKSLSEMRLSDTPMFVCSPDGFFIEANPALCRLFGATREEMLGTGWCNFVSADDKETTWQQWKMAIDSGSDITASYMMNPGQGGRTIRVQYRAVIHRNKEGEVLHILGKVRRLKSPKSHENKS